MRFRNGPRETELAETRRGIDLLGALSVLCGFFLFSPNWMVILGDAHAPRSHAAEASLGSARSALSAVFSFFAELWMVFTPAHLQVAQPDRVMPLLQSGEPPA